MAKELMDTESVAYNELYRKLTNTRGVTLDAGVAYTAGMVLTSEDGVVFEDSPIALTTDNNSKYDIQQVGILLEDVDATLGEEAGVVATGIFNRENVTFNIAQTEDAVIGVLQAKNIILEDWSK